MPPSLLKPVCERAVVRTDRCRTSFAVLHREVRRARFVRLAWTTAVGGTGVTLAATAGPELVKGLLQGLLG
jgi:hypothetical protein